MHDLRWIRDHAAEFDRGLMRRGLASRAEEILTLDRRWRELETEAQASQAMRNRLSREIGAARKRGEPIEELLSQIDRRKDLDVATAAQATKLREEIDEVLAGLPNLPAEEVPDGPD